MAKKYYYYHQTRDRYKEQYDDWKSSDLYKFINKNQQESNEAKKICKELSDYTCAFCGKKGAVDAHHIVPITEDFVDNSQDNLICLCRSCHEKVHRGTLVIDRDTKEVNVSKQFIDSSMPLKEYIEEFKKKYDCEVVRKTNGLFIVKGKLFFKVSANDIKKDLNHISKYLAKKFLEESTESNEHDL